MATQASTPATIICPSVATTKGSFSKIDAFKDNAVIYTNGRGVFIRSLRDPGASRAYFGHVKEATVARLSPSGFYVASGDVSGTVRVWDVAGQDQILKLETKVFNGKISDVCWDGESKRIIAVGDGKEKFGHAFSFDTGSSVGEITGHSKVVNAVAIRHQRPFRAVTAGDDNAVVFYHGVPFKFNKVIRTHKSFVNSVAYAPSGASFASASADRLVYLYDGSTADTLGSLQGHQGGIFSISYTADSKQLFSASADSTCRLWDVEAQKETSAWSFDQQQVATCTVGSDLISVSFNGDINIIDPRQGDKPSAVLSGHQKAITGLAAEIPASHTFYSGSYDGRINAFDDDGNCHPVSGSGHSSQILGLGSSPNAVFSIGMDDVLREIDAKQKTFAPERAFALTSQPKALATAPDGTAFVATSTALTAVKGGKAEKTTSIDFVPLSLAVSSTKGIVAVGGEDGKIRLYTLANLAPTGVFEKSRSAVTALAFSDDGNLLAAGESSGKVLVYDVASGDIKINSWVFHTGRITCIQFSGNHAVSASLDTNVYIWSVEKPTRKLALKNVHAGGATSAIWTGPNQITTGGLDAVIKIHTVALP